MDLGVILDLALVLAVIIGFFALFLWQFQVLPKWLFVVIALLATMVFVAILLFYVSLDMACARGGCL